MGAPASSFTAVITALAANLFVTVIKIIAFLLSGSGAMLSEAIHSAADTANQFLLFLGLKRGSKGPDEAYQYGYGGERFVFGILSAAGIFFIGCGVTVYHGIHALTHPHQPEIGTITFAILGASLLIEGGSMVVAFRAVAKEAAGEPFFRYVREKADPAAVAILLEDGAAVLGLLLATVGIVLAYFTGDPTWDALGSIVVGLILGYVAIHLVLENRALLLGKAVPKEIEARFVEILSSSAGVREVHNVQSRQLTPEAWSLKAEIALDDAWLAARMDEALPERLSGLDRSEVTMRLAVASGLAITALVDSLEAQVQAAYPQARFIDLEIDHTPDARFVEPAMRHASEG